MNSIVFSSFLNHVAVWIKLLCVVLLWKKESETWEKTAVCIIFSVGFDSCYSTSLLQWLHHWEMWATHTEFGCAILLHGTDFIYYITADPKAAASSCHQHIWLYISWVFLLAMSLTGCICKTERGVICSCGNS